MTPHDCKKPFLCSCEVEELSEKTSDKLMEVVKKDFKQSSEQVRLKRLLFAIEDGKTIKVWNGNESGVLWERIFKKEDDKYVSYYFCSGFFGDNKTVFETVDKLESRLSDYIEKFKFQIGK